MPIKDCWEGDQKITEVDHEDASKNHMPDLWKSDVADADVANTKDNEVESEEVAV